MKIKLIRNSDDFVILADEANGTYKIKLLELFVEFRKITADTQILRREMQALLEQSGGFLGTLLGITKLTRFKGNKF